VGGTTTEDKSATTSFSCNAESNNKGDGGLSSIEAGRKSLLGLIPMMISASK